MVVEFWVRVWVLMMRLSVSSSSAALSRIWFWTATPTLRKCSHDLFYSCTKIYSCSSGMCLPFKTLSRSCPHALRPQDLGHNVMHQSKMRRKVQGVSSRQFLRCQVWNNALITPELRETTSLWPLRVSSPGFATAVSLLISLQRHHHFSANKIKDALHTSSPLQPPWP